MATALPDAARGHAKVTPAAAPAQSGEVLIVGSCMGWHPIPVGQAADFYRAFGWASALGAAVLVVFACVLNA